MKTKTTNPTKFNSVLRKALIMIVFIIAGLQASAQCVASFTYTIVSGTTVQFTNTSTGLPPGGSYMWLFNGGTTISSNPSGPLHTFPPLGPYYAAVAILDANQNICDSIWPQIFIPNTPLPCYAYFIPFISNGNNNFEYLNQSSGAGSLTYLWDFGDGTTSALVNPTHNYTGSGIYNLCLTITDVVNSCSHTYCSFIGDNSGIPLTLTIRAGAAGVHENNIASSFDNYPNPFNENTTIVYELNENATVELSVIDIVGKQIAIIEEKETKAAGKHKIIWNVEGVSAGMYFLNLKVNDENTIKKITLAK